MDSQSKLVCHLIEPEERMVSRARENSTFPVKKIISLVTVIVVTAAIALMVAERSEAQKGKAAADPISENAQQMVEEGRQVFRFATFGDEAFWGDTIKLHQAIEGSKFGGVGPGLGPSAALAAGLKVDVDALPKSVIRSIERGEVDLNDPAVTLALIQAKAVVGVTGFFNRDGSLRSMGISFSICHSTVDNSLAPGIGHRLDGWPNRDLNVGAVVSLSPDLSAVSSLLGIDDSTLRSVLAAWGPGKFDAEVLLDGKGFRPDGKSAAVLIPPAFGLAGVNLGTWTGFGSTTYWNAFVANLEMHGQGTFFDPRLNDPVKYPIAAKAGFGNTSKNPDQITGQLAALHFYQLAIAAPAPPAGSFDTAAAARGAVIFNGKAQCATCHVPPLFTEPGWNMHAPSEIGIDDFQASRSPDGRYRTAPLRGLWAHTKGGFYHDGRFATLDDVVGHYNSAFSLGLSSQERSDLVQYLKSR